MNMHPNTLGGDPLTNSGFELEEPSTEYGETVIEMPEPLPSAVPPAQ